MGVRVSPVHFTCVRVCIGMCIVVYFTCTFQLCPGVYGCVYRYVYSCISAVHFTCVRVCIGVCISPVQVLAGR